MNFSKKRKNEGRNEGKKERRKKSTSNKSLIDSWTKEGNVEFAEKEI